LSRRVIILISIGYVGVPSKFQVFRLIPPRLKKG